MKTSTIINIVLAVAVIALYVLHFTGTRKADSFDKGTFQGSSRPVSIAYIKMDSMLFTYELAKKLNADFSQQQDAYKREYTDKRVRFEKEAAAFQEKVQRGGFLTEERARQEQERLMGVQ
jgi:outer membrane protein